MDKFNKDHIQKLTSHLLEIRTQDISHKTVELLAVFVLYADISRQDANINKQYGSNKEIIAIAIEDLSRKSEPVKDLLLPLKLYLESNLERLDDIINNFTMPKNDTMPHESVNYCLSLLEEYKGQHSNNLITPRVILELLNEISSIPEGAKIIDLNARKGEWADLLMEDMFSERLVLTDYCFEPFHFVINILKAKLTRVDNRQVYLQDNYDLSDIEQNKYDVIFANPSFGNMPKESYWYPRQKIYSHFLYQALTACKPGGKIIYIVPESFLNSRGKFDYKLREELISGGDLKTVIRLPNSTFEPYAKVHTAILIIEKCNEKSDVNFIDLNKKLNEIGQQEIQDIVKLNQGKSTNKSFPNSITSIREIAKNDFDLRASSYIKKIDNRTLADPKEHRNNIKTKEKELDDIRFKIENLIEFMEQER
jgi:hypothetical protein